MIPRFFIAWESPIRIRVGGTGNCATVPSVPKRALFTLFVFDSVIQVVLRLEMGKRD
jgi:hypothetical protein